MNARRGFSLIELVVVIGIIVLLASLVLGVAGIVIGQSEKREAANSITLLDAAIQEFETVAGRPITYGTTVTGEVYEVQETLNDDQIVVAVLDLIGNTSSVRDILARLDTEYLRTDGADQELVDPWDNRLLVVFPGRTWRVGDAQVKDVDGTIRTVREDFFGVCRNRKPLVVSAGPDGRFGNLSGTEDEQALAEDNLYSYEADTP